MKISIGTLLVLLFASVVSDASAQCDIAVQVDSLIVDDMDISIHITRDGNPDCVLISDLILFNPHGEEIINTRHSRGQDPFWKEVVAHRADAPGDFALALSVGAAYGNNEYYSLEDIVLFTVDPNGELDGVVPPEATTFDIKVDPFRETCFNLAAKGGVEGATAWYYNGLRDVNSRWRNDMRGEDLCLHPNKDFAFQDTFSSFAGDGSRITHFHMNVEMSGSVSVEDTPQEATEKIGVYPNPARTQMHLSFSLSHTTIAQIEVFDLLGRRVWFEEEVFSSGRNVVAIATTGLPNGLYSFRLTTGDIQQHGEVTILK